MIKSNSNGIIYYSIKIIKNEFGQNMFNEYLKTENNRLVDFDIDRVLKLELEEPNLQGSLNRLNTIVNESIIPIVLSEISKAPKAFAQNGELRKESFLVIIKNVLENKIIANHIDTVKKRNFLIYVKTIDYREQVLRICAHALNGDARETISISDFSQSLSKLVAAAIIVRSSKGSFPELPTEESNTLVGYFDAFCSVAYISALDRVGSYIILGVNRSFANELIKFSEVLNDNQADFEASRNRREAVFELKLRGIPLANNPHAINFSQEYLMLSDKDLFEPKNREMLVRILESMKIYFGDNVSFCHLDTLGRMLKGCAASRSERYSKIGDRSERLKFLEEYLNLVSFLGYKPEEYTRNSNYLGALKHLVKNREKFPFLPSAPLSEICKALIKELAVIESEKGRQLCSDRYMHSWFNWGQTGDKLYTNLSDLVLMYRETTTTFDWAQLDKKIVVQSLQVKRVGFDATLTGTNRPELIPLVKNKIRESQSYDIYGSSSVFRSLVEAYPQIPLLDFDTFSDPLLRLNAAEPSHARVVAHDLGVFLRSNQDSLDSINKEKILELLEFIIKDEIVFSVFESISKPKDILEVFKEKDRVALTKVSVPKNLWDTAEISDKLHDENRDGTNYGEREAQVNYLLTYDQPNFSINNPYELISLELESRAINISRSFGEFDVVARPNTGQDQSKSLLEELLAKVGNSYELVKAGEYAGYVSLLNGLNSPGSYDVDKKDYSLAISKHFIVIANSEVSDLVCLIFNGSNKESPSNKKGTYLIHRSSYDLLLSKMKDGVINSFDDFDKYVDGSIALRDISKTSNPSIFYESMFRLLGQFSNFQAMYSWHFKKLCIEKGEDGSTPYIYEFLSKKQNSFNLFPSHIHWGRRYPQKESKVLGNRGNFHIHKTDDKYGGSSSRLYEGPIFFDNSEEDVNRFIDYCKSIPEGYFPNLISNEYF